MVPAFAGCCWTVAICGRQRGNSISRSTTCSIRPVWDACRLWLKGWLRFSMRPKGRRASRASSLFPMGKITTINEAEAVRAAVRDGYSQIAQQDGSCCSGVSCCGSEAEGQAPPGGQEGGEEKKRRE